jgi:nitrogen fixation/metabolism regulation signal transduction histidine kinase
MVKLLFINLIFISGFIILLPDWPWLFGLTTALTLFLLIILLQRYRQQQDTILYALGQGLRSLQDGDFSISLAVPSERNFGAQRFGTHQHLIELFNEVTNKLREEKKTLYQRELLLDKVVNASNVVTVLVNQRDTIIFANRSARQFFNIGSLLGQSWQTLLAQHTPELIQHSTKNNAIIQLTDREQPFPDNGSANYIEQSWHLSQHQLNLHATRHQLVLLKPIARELQQQELQTWKKVIRFVNHELNNTIAPISSMCHSGRVLAERINEPQLDRVFNTIAGRIKKLSEFIQNYSQLATLSAPQKQSFNIVYSIEQLKSLYPFELTTCEPVIMLMGDASQIEQMLINLLKNAKEVSPDLPSQISIEVCDGQLHITIRDFGPGMAQDVMQKAFLPYYSTKAEGSGIGLSVCREVMDAHQGQIILNNHPQGGLQVSLHLPRV